MHWQYIDAHAHPYFSAFDADREAVVARMQEAQVGAIVVGVDAESSRQALDFAKQYPSVSAGVAVGIHPTSHEYFDGQVFASYVSDEAVVAVGECGLDYFRCDPTDAARQKDLFKAQIEFAIKYQLPLMLHIRSSQNSTDAHEDAHRILLPYKKAHPELHLHLHFFTADASVVEAFLPLGATFGIPGVVTFATELQETIPHIPADRILVESDAPYAAPVPHRGKRNEPVFVRDTLKSLAAIYQMPEEELCTQVRENTIRTFSLGGLE